MHVSAIEITAILTVASVVSAVTAVAIDRHFYQDRKIKEWKDKNEQSITELQQKAAGLLNILNGVMGQLLALGIKLPRDVVVPPADTTSMPEDIPENEPTTKSFASGGKRYE